MTNDELVSDVAVLYVDSKGDYPKRFAHWWDEKRDARVYEGTLPIVAHPACGPWGGLSRLYKGKEGGEDCGLIAVEQVRRHGGVLEHPQGSRLWEACGLPRPGAAADSYGGYTVSVRQCDWGHACAKPTWLYIVGAQRETIEAEVAAQPRREPTHRIWGSRKAYMYDAKAKALGLRGAHASMRKRTPIAFMLWLASIARRCAP